MNNFEVEYLNLDKTKLTKPKHDFIYLVVLSEIVMLGVIGYIVYRNLTIQMLPHTQYDEDISINHLPSCMLISATKVAGISLPTV